MTNREVRNLITIYKSTVVEKFNVLGDSAIEEVEQLQNQLNDLLEFWGYDSVSIV